MKIDAEAAREAARQHDGRFGPRISLEDEINGLSLEEEHQLDREREKLTDARDRVGQLLVEADTISSVPDSEETRMIILRESWEWASVGEAVDRAWADSLEGRSEDRDDPEAVAGHLYDIAVQRWEKDALDSQLREHERIEHAPFDNSCEPVREPVF
ncbi:hypothetical protein [Aeromicrobium sp. CTD01-1L150]|uniref:hypothetical protein n=1 Tax=Aeromicrobium sp. CTD01-1L150 TaxID=3341830 RepID=UPI0035C21D2E